MFPTSFEESNATYDKPSELSHEECEALSVFRGYCSDGTPVVISCWKPTAEELAEINRTGRVWVHHLGHSLQPHSVSGLNPFE